MDIVKDKIGHGQSYALKSSVLEKLIDDRKIVVPVSLFQVCKSWWKEGVLFRADFYPVGWASAIEFEGDAGDRLHVTCRSVSSNERIAVLTYLEQTVLSDFADWVLKLEKLPSNSPIRHEKQSFTRSWPIE